MGWWCQRITTCWGQQVACILKAEYEDCDDMGHEARLGLQQCDHCLKPVKSSFGTAPAGYLHRHNIMLAAWSLRSAVQTCKPQSDVVSGAQQQHDFQLLCVSTCASIVHHGHHPPSRLMIC